MGEPAAQRLSYAEYLALEAETGVRHEFCSGEVFAMAGGSADHALLAANLIRHFGNAAEGTPCRPFTADLKVWLAHADRAVYPDVTLVCGQVEHPVHDGNACTNPKLIVEVLSPSTEDHDRGRKARDYRGVAGMDTLVFVDSERVMVEVHSRNPDESWTLRTFGPGETLRLPTPDLQLSVDRIYAGTELLNPAAAPESPAQ
ncbi:MAG: Uma2 family endonuclease [Myxococcota bacterium]|nr:Uma2 family endonuclease [Myxococcota bacterium]